jgi:hypothetical protein
LPPKVRRAAQPKRVSWCKEPAFLSRRELEAYKLTHSLCPLRRYFAVYDRRVHESVLERVQSVSIRHR